MTRKKRRKRRTVILFLIIFLISCLALYFLIFKVAKVGSSHVIDQIKGYDYTLEKRDTQLMKTNFASLKEVLSADKVDYEKYAKLLSKLYIIDLYTIKNKNSKYDVGSMEYIYKDHRDNFKIKVQDTLYKFVEEKHGRKQKLPEVKSVDISDLKETTYKYHDKEYDAYEMTASWKYTKDLGYDDKAQITVVNIKDVLYIASFTPEENE